MKRLDLPSKDLPFSYLRLEQQQQQQQKQDNFMNYLAFLFYLLSFCDQQKSIF